jgi:O-antigen biosynthesis protein
MTLFSSAAECLDGGTPVAVRVIDVERGVSELRVPPSSSGKPYHRLLALVRRDGWPLGWASLPVSPDGTVALDAVCGLADLASRPAPSPVQVGDWPADAASAAPDESCLIDGRTAPSWRDRISGDSARDRAAASLLSVVVATCANAKSVVGCVEAIKTGAAGPCEVVVVENRPAGSTVERVLMERFRDDDRVRYVEERRAGLARARNAGLRAARGDVVAFTDDDVLVDPEWVPAIRAAFAKTPQVDCVTGLILPLELETPTQLLVERFAGYGKGFVPRVYSLEKPPYDQPLFPYTAGYFGSGANMAFRTRALRDLGGFDPVLGTGTRARGCEDLDICIRLLHAGRSLAYEPRAIVWHRHPDTNPQIRRRAFDYGASLGAMLTKHILLGSDRWGLISRVPQAARYYTNPKSRKNASRGPMFPKSLTRLERVGLLYGPVAYLVSRLGAQR